MFVFAFDAQEYIFILLNNGYIAILSENVVIPDEQYGLPGSNVGRHWGSCFLGWYCRPPELSCRFFEHLWPRLKGLWRFLGWVTVASLQRSRDPPVATSGEPPTDRVQVSAVHASGNGRATRDRRPGSEVVVHLEKL
jgi:hypothetical protein